MQKKPLILTLLGLFLLSPPAWSNYDASKIRNGINEQKKVFQVKDWQKNDQVWVATSGIRGLKISVSEQSAELVLPFINFTQKREAKQRCEALGNIALSAGSDMDRQKIKKLIYEAERTHEIQVLDLNNARLQVIPKLLGSYVRLYCKVKSNA